VPFWSKYVGYVYAMCVENYLHRTENCLIRENMQAASYSILSKFYCRPRLLPLCFQILNLPYTKLIVFLVFLREWLRKLPRILQLRRLQFSTPPSSSEFSFAWYFVSGRTFLSFLLLFYGLRGVGWRTCSDVQVHLFLEFQIDK